ncbi:Crp/Fnr family transcriptional regulator [Neorhizobium lilium]|uniref:Crp/Fnr family transcriptional regulator n=1 Tax=Neorhizobium lilium TaxID=2503024 RepID=A0A444LDU7_9HYPH|nr:Crp/Fnr family transcriptional regulator [Neorhizobium lilium]RWX75874.1 Crp/Fnr family transcriptional regulator [Neorhizobium lilium]
MSVSMRQNYRNVLLNACSAECLALLEPHLELVQLSKGDIIASPAEAILCVYFLEDCLVSTVSHLDEERDVELGIVGREGISGQAVVLGDDRTPFTVRVQMPGMAWQLKTDDLRRVMEASQPLRNLLLLFVRAQELQLASTAAANQRGSVEERLARCILMGFDRIDGDRFHATHDTLAWLISVRRPSITDALHALEGKGFIRSVRNMIIIRDVDGLRTYAGAIYGLAEREYARLIGTDFREHRSPDSPAPIPNLFVSDEYPQDES